MMTASEIYGIIAAEIRDGTQDVPTWTQAFAEAEGDDAKTKARYIRLRLAQLSGGVAAKMAVSVVAVTPSIPEKSPCQMPAYADLRFVRDSLAARLAESGRPSLYSQLNLSANSEDGAIAHEIASAKAKAAQGATLSAEELYAIQTLGDPASREQYDRKLLDTLSPVEAGPASFAPAVPGNAINPAIHIAAAVVLIAIAAYSGLGYYTTRVRNETAVAAARVQEAVILKESSNRSAHREAMEAAAQLRAEASARSVDIEAEREMARQREIDRQQFQAEERRVLAEQQKARQDRERETRIEQEATRRMVIEAERDLCVTARRNNNPGAIARYCK